MIMQTINRFFQYTPLDTNTTTQSRAPLWMFMGGVLGYCLFVYLVFGWRLFSGEPYQETSWVYFVGATGNLRQFLVKDLGYFVFPQQIIVLVGYFLAVPAKYIPYFYNGMGALVNGLMIFSFCLPRFRHLIPSDIFRLVFCITIACTATGYLREFMNFTYYAAFFIIIICAMMMVAKPDKMPWYVKTLPIFFLAKPVLLGLFPILVLALFYTRNNFRVIIGLCFIAGITQFINVYFFPHGDLLNKEILTDRFVVLIDNARVQINAIWQAKYTLLLPSFLQYILAIGTTAFLIYVCYTWRHPVKILIIFGLIAIIGSNVIVSFGTNGAYFTNWQHISELLGIYRWTIVQILGMIAIAGALCVYLSEKIGKSHRWYGNAIIIFIIWLVVSGWGYRFYDKNRIPKTQWQAISWQSNINDGVFNKVCTGVLPIGHWWYNPGIPCTRLGEFDTNNLQVPVLADTTINLLKPANLDNRAVQSIIAIYHVPANHSDYQLSLQVNDQIITKMIKRISRAGKNMAVQFNLPAWINGEDIHTISLKASIHIYVSTEKDQLPENAHAHWYVK